MPTRDERLAAARERVLEAATDRTPIETASELSRESVRANARDTSGVDAAASTEVSIRMHGKGVVGNRVPVAQAAPILRDLQMAVTWIGSRLRQVSDERAVKSPEPERPGIRRATQLYLEPQFGAGSIVFHLTSSAASEDEPNLLTDSDLAALEGVLDESVERLLGILTVAEGDAGQDIGELTAEIRRMGALVASSLDRIATGMTQNELDLDVGWTSVRGRRAVAKIGRRGALAIHDAVQASRTETGTIELVGVLETASTGKDLIRIETPSGDDYRMTVSHELGDTLGPLLGKAISARAEETVIRHESGQVTRTYRLLDAIEVEELPEDAHPPAESEEPPF